MVITHCCDPIMNVSQRLFLLKCIVELVVHGIVQRSIQGTLVVRCVLWIAIKNFSNGIDTSWRSIFRPEIRMHLHSKRRKETEKERGGGRHKMMGEFLTSGVVSTLIPSNPYFWMVEWIQSLNVERTNSLFWSKSGRFANRHTSTCEGCSMRWKARQEINWSGGRWAGHKKNVNWLY